MRFYVDCEFVEAGPEHPIHLLSIGVVADDGREFYAVNADCPLEHVNDFVRAHVLPHIDWTIAKHRDQIRDELAAFVGLGGDKPEFCGWYCDYDWVVVCQLFGDMSRLPPSWPKYCRDLKQWVDAMGNPRLPKQGKGEHHALKDARWTKQAWDQLALRLSSKGQQ